MLRRIVGIAGVTMALLVGAQVSAQASREAEEVAPLGEEAPQDPLEAQRRREAEQLAEQEGQEEVQSNQAHEAQQQQQAQQRRGAGREAEGNPAHQQQHRRAGDTSDPQPQVAQSRGDGGCSASGYSSGSLMTPALVLFCGALLLGRRRRCRSSGR